MIWSTLVALFLASSIHGLPKSDVPVIGTITSTNNTVTRTSPPTTTHTFIPAEAGLVNDKSVPNVAQNTSSQPVYTKCRIPGKVIALTFDDGPYQYNHDLVDYLNSQGVKATFFVNGNNYDCIYEGRYPSYLRHLWGWGHQVGSHTWSHPNLPSLSDKRVTRELQKVNEAIAYILGVKPRYFRPPYGDIDPRVANLVRDQNQIPVNWNFDSGDSVGSTVAESKAAYTKWLKTGKSLIALNHETEPGTVYSLTKTIVPQFKKAGYRFVTIAECLNLGSAYVTPTGPKGPGYC